MRKIALDSAEPGMVLAKDIYGETGQVLLKADVKIKAKYIEYLRLAGIESLYIHDSRIEDVQVEDPITEKTRHEARMMVKDIALGLEPSGSTVKITNSINIGDREILNTVNKIIDELLESKDAVVQLVDIRTKNNYLFAHSVNCAVLATLVAIKMNFKHKELRWIATGALFHDLGMIGVSDQIFQKPTQLTVEEYAIIKEHPLHSYNILKTTEVFDARAGAVVLQHHERFHGQGYPKGLKGDEISPLAQITGLADVFDALTSERPYRKAFKPHEAVEMLISWGEEMFDLSILQHFLSAVAAYPVGSHVLLSNGDSGLVVANNPGFTLRPVIRILYEKGEAFQPHRHPHELDLSHTLDLTIVKVIE